MTTTAIPTQTGSAPTVAEAAPKVLSLLAGYVGHRTVSIGLRTGLVRALADSPGSTADDLSDADRRVLTVIRKTLLDYEPLRATRPVLEVTVQAGLVQLRGRVRTSAIKEIAELLVLQLEPVRAVRNDLVADPEVVRAVADALAADPEIGPACPVVDCRDGVAIIIGDVPTEEAARRAVDIATAVPLAVETSPGSMKLWLSRYLPTRVVPV